MTRYLLDTNVLMHWVNKAEGFERIEERLIQSAALGGSLHAYLSNQGKTIGERDSMIAATAMSKRYTMVTDNHKEFSRVPGIVLESWRTG
jgi:predicted nucleic acid-binding protein